MPEPRLQALSLPRQPIEEGARPSPVVLPQVSEASLPNPPSWIRASTELLFDWWAYQIDAWQRSQLFVDTLRARADNFLAHEAAGMPPLLDFDYDLVLDARQLDPPSNYALLSITRCREQHAKDVVDPAKPPVIIMDPRAGHGPGIGGFRHASEVGMALHEGFPTYFVMFFPHPMPHQTLGDVLHGLRRFVEEVAALHEGRAPVLYGNCQAGWAAMLLASECRGLAGPAVLNGSPLSYWAGATGVNPMRLAGGLMGGDWMTALLADLGNGELDGAWLVANFETLNPAHALWDKYVKLFTDIDTERERFLEFERWWSGFYFLSREEILFIVENLFLGNKLERGQLQLDACCILDLKRIKSPIIIFASSGDNITPPHQALNWVPVVYPTTVELKAAGQRIVYLLNQKVGHLGIFVSANVVSREHHAIMESLRIVPDLAPGLYEMLIEGQHGEGADRDRHMRFRFEEREVSDIRFATPACSFHKVQALAQRNRQRYTTFLQPLVQGAANSWMALAMKWMHPMRASRYLFAEPFNPWMWPVKWAAERTASARRPVRADNPFVQTEQAWGALVSSGLRAYQETRDAAAETLFARLFGP